MKTSNWLNLNIDASFFDISSNISIFIDFAARLFELTEGLYGYACHRNEFYENSRLARPTMIRGRLVSTITYDPRRQYLPGLYWANFFGGVYVDWFGRDSMLSVPSDNSQELNNGAFMFLTGQSPLTYQRARHQVAAAKKHLGEDAFFNIVDPQRPCRSPFHDGTIDFL